MSVHDDNHRARFSFDPQAYPASFPPGSSTSSSSVPLVLPVSSLGRKKRSGLKSTAPVRAIVFTPSSSSSCSKKAYALTGGDDRRIRLYNPLRVYDESTPGDLRNDRSPPSAYELASTSDGHSHPVTCLDVDLSHSNIVSGDANGTVVLTDVGRLSSTEDQNGQNGGGGRSLVRRYRHGNAGNASVGSSTGERASAINAVRISGDGSLLFSGGHDGTVKVWDVRNRRSEKPAMELTDARDSVTSVLVEGSEIITGGLDGTVRCYDIRMGLLTEFAYAEDAQEGIASMSSSRTDGGSHTPCVLAINGLDGYLRYLDRSALTGIDGPGNKLAKPPVVVGGGHASGKYLTDCAFLRGGQFVLTGTDDGRPALYDFCGPKKNMTVRKKNRISRWSKLGGDGDDANAVARRQSTEIRGLVGFLRGHQRATCAVAAANAWVDVSILPPAQREAMSLKNGCQTTLMATAGYDGDAIIWGIQL